MPPKEGTINTIGRDLLAAGLISTQPQELNIGKPAGACGISLAFLKRLLGVLSGYDDTSTEVLATSVLSPLAAKAGKLCRYG